MKYIEVSKKIKTKATQKDVQDRFLQRLEKAFKVENVKKSKTGFSLVAKSGGCKSLIRHAAMNIDATVKKDKDTVRILISGHSKMACSLLVSYTTLFFLVLVVGLLPGSIETSGEDSGALDTLVLLIFGIFIFYDINKKISEPEAYLEAVLNSLDVEYG
ncbi:MAG: hypothetical protein KDJ35_07925 [Alphaproteobacteria bacterium]|nr:hypothetical protein [Alphaproteobacteria bacterium]